MECFFQVCRSKYFHEFGLTKVRGLKREQLKHNPCCHVNRLLFMGLAKPTEAITTRMREQLLGYAFMGLNVKFRSDFEFFFVVDLILSLKMEMKLMIFFYYMVLSFFLNW